MNLPGAPNPPWPKSKPGCLTLLAALVALAAALIAAGCGSIGYSPTPPPSASPSASPSPSGGQPPLHQVSDPGAVSGTLHGPCHFAAGGQLPDSRCTPGAYDPQITAGKLCAPGYTTRTYRPPESETSTFKYKQAYPAYGIADVPGTVSELDHDVPLELGGANDASNLWPQLGRIPNPKDRVEGALHAWVCAVNGSAADTRLRDAQTAIADNWTTAELVLGIK